MKLGILTSVERRHRFFVQAVSRHFRVVAAGYEQTGYSPAATGAYDLTPDEKQIVAAHFTERERQEERFFGDVPFLEHTPGCRVLRIEPGCLNSDETLSLLTQAEVDTVLIYGTNLIRPPLLGRWPSRMINMHLGLSPYYRGTATNFYPLLNDEPEYVGATIHLLDAGIDSGAILRHARPEIEAEDQPHTIGCKAILAGIEALIGVLRDLEAGQLNPVPQWEVPNARLYLRKDYHPRQVVQLAEMVADGLIPHYIARARAVVGRVRLIE